MYIYQEILWYKRTFFWKRILRLLYNYLLSNDNKRSQTGIINLELFLQWRYKNQENTVKKYALYFPFWCCYYRTKESWNAPPIT